MDIMRFNTVFINNLRHQAHLFLMFQFVSLIIISYHMEAIDSHMTDKTKSTSNALDVARQENFTLAGFAMWSRLSRTTVYRPIKDGKLKATKVGRKTIIRREAAESLMASK